MVVEAEIVCQQSVPVLDVPFFGKGSNIEEIDQIVAISSPVSSPEVRQVRVAAESVSSDLSTAQLVFDGHGGPEAAAYIRRNALRLFFEDVNFPQSCEVDDDFLEGVENSFRKSFLLADLALADDCTVNCTSGTTSLTALIFGRLAKAVMGNHMDVVMPGKELEWFKARPYC